MSLKRLSKGAVKIAPAMEMSELAEVGDGFGGHCLPPTVGLSPRGGCPAVIQPYFSLHSSPQPPRVSRVPEQAELKSD